MPPAYDQLVSVMEPDQSHPVKTGPVYLSQRSGGKKQRARVLLSIYSSRYEHYAVISQERVICKDCGFLNLKHCKARKMDSTDGSFEIICRDGDKGSLVITPLSSSDSQGWITAVNNAHKQSQLSCCRRVASRGNSSCLPTLAEESPDE